MKRVLLILTFLFAYLNVALPGIDIDTVKFKKETKEYTVELYYPKIRNAGTESARGFNKLIQNFVEDKKTEFLKDAKAIDYDPSLPYEFFVNYDVKYTSNDFVSVILYTYYFTGGAHGSTIAYTFNYDLKNNKNLKLSDLFEGKYLNVISEYCIKEILKEGDYADESWVKEGAAPKPENYEAFTLSNKELIIHFQQYQVLPYAAGMPEVVVPKSVLNDYIKKDGILNR